MLPQVNPHIHTFLTEGASGNETVWRKIPHICFISLRKRWYACDATMAPKNHTGIRGFTYKHE